MKDLLQIYGEVAAGLHNKLLIIVAGNNDRDDPAAMEKDARSLVEMNRKRSIGTMIVAEPMGHEQEEVEASRRILKRLAREYGIPFVDMHRHLNKKRGLGFLWWDEAHMADLGHILVAEELHRRSFATGTTFSGRTPPGVPAGHWPTFRGSKLLTKIACGWDI